MSELTNSPESAQKPVPKWMKYFFYFIGFCFSILLIGIVTVFLLPESEAEKEIAKAEETKKAQDDSLLTCYVMAESFLKKNLKDPDSYEEVEKQNFFLSNPTPTQYIQVTLKYRAKNSFGALNIEQRCFNFSKDLIMTEQFECK